MTITQKDIDTAESLLESQGPEAFYTFLESKGSRYATLAKGVANNEWVAGRAAISFMNDRYVDKHSEEMPPSTVERIKGAWRGLLLIFLKKY